MTRALAASLLVAAACGVPQEIYDTRLRELDRCKTDLTRAQSDHASAQKNADELATEASELRDRVTTLETDRMRQASTAGTPKQSADLYKNAATLADRRADLYQLIVAKLRPLVEQKQISVEGSKGRLLVRLSDATVFDAGRAELRPDGQTLLRALGAVMKQIDRDVLVAVHNDNQPLPKTSPFRSGWEMTTTRAVTLVRFFQGEGVDPRHLGAAGYSEFSFLHENRDDTARTLNRRIELVFMPTAEELLPLPPELGKRIAEQTRAGKTPEPLPPEPAAR
jgi:chemotaxis protein MotB